MAIASTSTLIFSCAKPDLRPVPSHFRSSPPSPSPLVSQLRGRSLTHDPISLSGLVGTGLVAATFMAGGGPDSTAMAAVDALHLSEPANALSLPTWAVHVSSVVEWFLSFHLRKVLNFWSVVMRDTVCCCGFLRYEITHLHSVFKTGLKIETLH